MPKLHQIVAVVAGKKTRVEKEYGDLNKTLQKPALFNGQSRRYKPIDEKGEQLPPEDVRIQQSVSSIFESLRKTLTDTMDAIATQEYGNTLAMADVVIDGTVILPQVPLGTLLYLEKQMNDLRTFVGNVPTLDPAEQWTKDSNTGNYVTVPVDTHRNKKTPRVIVKYDATPEHPAQTELVTEDVLAGYWTTVKSSTAMQGVEKRAIIAKIDSLQEALRMAREEANSIEVENKRVASAVLDYVLGGEKK